MKGLASLIGALGAGMNGYAAGRDQFRDGERKKLLAERQDEEYGHAKKKRDDEDRYQRDIADSQKDITPEIVTESGATYANDEALAQDSRELNRMHAATGAPAPALAPASYTAGGQSHASLAAANGALAGQNSRASRETRAAEIARATPGKMEDARRFEEYARKAIGEGTDQVLGAIAASAPTVDAIKKAGGKLKGIIDPGAAEAFNTTGGKWKIGADTVVEHFIDKDAAGREIVNSRVVGADGREIVGDVRTANRAMLDVKGRMEVEGRDTSTFQTGQQIAEQQRSHKAAEEDRRLTRQQSAAQHAQSLGIQQQRVNMERNAFKNQTPAGKIAEIEEIIGTKLTVDERKRFMGIASGKATPRDKEALIDKMTEEYAKTNPDPKAAVAYADTLRRSFADVEMTGQFEAVLRDNFKGLDQGSPGYAAKYAQAMAQPGVSVESLASMGYPAPPAAQLRTIQQQGAAPAMMAGGGSGSTPSGQSVSDRDKRIQQFNRTVGGASARRQAAMEQRQADVAANFDAQLGTLRRGMPRDEAQKVLTWIGEQGDAGVLTNAQIQQARKARLAAGF
jgi:hypothetical protein